MISLGYKLEGCLVIALIESLEHTLLAVINVLTLFPRTARIIMLASNTITLEVIISAYFLKYETLEIVLLQLPREK